MEIRREEKSDYEAIYDVIYEAFKSAEHVDGNEQDLVSALRDGKSYIPELSLVAVMDDEIVGHIMFTKMYVGDDVVLALAPLSVLPEYQRQGVGKQLIQEGHRRAVSLGYTYSIVLGSEQYYPKFGYQPVTSFGIEVPEGVPENFFMACRLVDKADHISGKVKYADEFGM